jgi:hypothetical protein
MSLSQHAKEIGLQSPKDENREIIRKWVYGSSERLDWMMRVISAAEGVNFPSIYECAQFTRI